MLKTFFIAFVLTITCSMGLGQTREPVFSIISGADGTTPGKINGITHDREGVLWFTDQTNRCIIRYDGTHMKRYVGDPKDTSSLGNDGYPECIATDSSGIIWIGFYAGGGLDRFDPATGNFTHYRHRPHDARSLANDTVSALLADHLGNLWVGTNGGLDLLDQKTGTFRHFPHNPLDSTSLSCNIIRALYEDHEGTLWIGTGFPFNLISPEGGLNRLDRTKGNFIRYLHDPKNPHSLINNKVRAIFEDSRGTFWVGTAGDGLHTMDRKTGSFERHVYNPNDPSQFSRPEFKGAYDHITFITEDPEGAIWVGTFSNGMNRYDPVTKKVTHFGTSADKSSGFKDESPWSAYVSKDGLFLIATQSDNLYRVDLFNNIIPRFLLNSAAVNAIYEESPSVQWFGTDSGLVRKNLTNGTLQVFKNDTHNPNINIANNIVNGIMKDQQGNLWLGTAGGLNHFNPVTGTFTRFRHDPNNKTGIGGFVIAGICMDQDSGLWISLFDGGLDRMDTKTGLFTHYTHDASDTNSISNNNVVFVMENGPNDIWAGNWNNGGVNRLNVQTGHFRHYLSQNNITSILKDGDGTIWAGSQNGLFRYDAKADEFYQVNEENTGLNIADVVSLVTDNQNNIWIGSGSGIYKFNPRKKEGIYYGKENGIHSQALSFCSYKMRDGQLFFGTLVGYFAFYPSKLKNSTLVPKIQFTNFWINNQEIKSGKNSVLDAPFSETKEIHLHYDQNVFSFSFDAMNYTNADDKKIIYKLDGYEKEWRKQSSDPRAYYFNVPPGKYILRVKGVNTNNGIWQEKDINIIISPPWWKTWWAYCIYAILFIGLAFSLDRFQKVRILKAERERTRDREMAQAREIEKAYNELKLTQAQLIQSEKMASLGELTAGIAHEIQNPLNFVNNFSEINKELTNELQQELKSGKIEEAIIISNDIISNEEKINHHGKRADAIVKSMLQHTRSSASVKEPTDINALADEYLRLSYHGLRAKDKSFNATMITDFDPGIGSVNLIPQNIGRVLLNLYNNAFYAVSEKKKQQPADYEPTVSVSTRKVDSKVEISVKDNGNGIPQKVIDKIFQPFFTTKPPGQGTGLGLSLSYDIVRAHGGEIKVQTREGEYTEFVIQIPAV